MFDRDKIWQTLKTYGEKILYEYEKDNVNQLAAAIAYYATFSLVPTLLLLIALSTLILGEETARQELFANLAILGGAPAVDLAETALDGTTEVSGTLASIISGIAILMGSTQLFAQLQHALDRVWEVKPGYGGIGIKTILRRRLIALGLLICSGALVIGSFIASAAISVADKLVGGFQYWEAVNIGGTYIIGTLLMALVLQYMPAVKLKFRDTRLGAAITVGLLMVSKSLFTLYLANASMSSTYGAAGTLIAFLLWVYVSALIVLCGAEFTQVHAQIQGRDIEVADWAERRFDA